jgi:hypothetical protein
VELVGFEARYRKRDAVGILAGAHDVAGRVVVVWLIPQADRLDRTSDRSRCWFARRDQDSRFS